MRHVVCIAVLVVEVGACGPAAPGEFAGMGWFQGRVFVCRHHRPCARLRYPTPLREPVYVDLRSVKGHAHASTAVNNDGTFGAYGAPGKYLATLRPAKLFGVRVGRVPVVLSANGRISFDLTYGRRRG